MGFRYILFDLDGTIADPKPGITGSARYALAKLGIEPANLDELEHFIGPPLWETFRNRYGLSSDKTQLAVRYYREYFGDRGIYENALYPGMATLLRDLHEAGKALGLATTKPVMFAERILVNFNVRSYFYAIAGPTFDDNVSKKEDVVRQALSELGCQDRREAVMVGDTEYDLAGAVGNGLHFVGVRWGYGFGKGASGPEAREIEYVDNVEGLRAALVG
jgi:phosphoglycolate phosphatase